MNLKEAFRYQNFLDTVFGTACSSIQNREHSLNVTKKHLCSKVNPESEDFEEEVKTGEEFFKNDDVIAVMLFLIEEKEKLSLAINNAKKSIDLDIDVATSVNKCRQQFSRAIGSMMRHKASSRVDSTVGHKFNVTGDPVDYKYEVEVISTEAYNRDTAKKTVKELNCLADRTSSEIDAAKINTQVDYTPVFDVNDSFEDVMNTFIATRREDYQE